MQRNVSKDSDCVLAFPLRDHRPRVISQKEVHHLALAAEWRRRLKILSKLAPPSEHHVLGHARLCHHVGAVNEHKP